MAHRHWADLAFKWKVYGEDVARVLVETRMPFGLSSAPSIADRLTQAVVRLMRSKGYTVVGYLDDFLVVGVTEERCREAYEFLLFLLRDLGFPVNEDKCEPPTQELVFLGIQLSTVGQCTASVDEARVRHVVEMITGVLSDVRVKASRLQSLLGLLTFVSQVIFGSGLYLRSSFSAVARVQHRTGGTRARSLRYAWVSVSRQMARDLSWWLRMVQAYASNRVVFGVLRLIPNVLFTTDASSSWGMGGFLSGQWFAVSWEELRAMPRKPVYPFSNQESSHINYLELFAVYWAIRRFGGGLRGMRVPLYVDNQSTEHMVRNLRAKSAVFIALLKEIHIMLIRFNIRIDVRYINTKDNILADALSRGPSGRGVFERALASWEESVRVISDFDDWQLQTQEVVSLDVEYGPIEVDACCDEIGSNAHFAEFWSSANDCRRHDWAGRTIYCNPPFSLMFSILLHFLKCKMSSPVGTSAIFVLPVWLSHDAVRMVLAMPEWFEVVRRYEAGTRLFTAPRDVSRKATREDVGPTKWGVWVVRCPPVKIQGKIPDWVLDCLDRE
jgi:hypothetical protein